MDRVSRAARRDRDVNAAKILRAEGLRDGSGPTGNGSVAGAPPHGEQRTGSTARRGQVHSSAV